jgi:hypothetical protein
MTLREIEDRIDQAENTINNSNLTAADLGRISEELMRAAGYKLVPEVNWKRDGF